MNLISAVLIGVIWQPATNPPQDTSSTPTYRNEEVLAVLDAYELRKEELSTGGSIKLEDYERLQEEALGNLRVDQLTIEQLTLVEPFGILFYKSRRDDVIAALEPYYDDDSVDGAAAVVLLLGIQGAVVPDFVPEHELQQRLLQRTLSHPALIEAAQAGLANSLFAAIRDVSDPALWKAHQSEILALQPLLSETMPLGATRGLLQYYELAKEMGVEATRLNQIRDQVVRVARHFLERTTQEPKLLQPRQLESLQALVQRLEGAAEQGRLLGQMAPVLDILWSSDSAIESLEDLRGKVVILDFWATWCGPCIATFPQVRELRDHYLGAPVVILGVTSLQGTHIDPEHGAIETKDDPEHEFELMDEYLGKKDITWPVVFTEQPVFNPDYGVNGIPHVAILDPAGVVRYNDLHPADPLQDKVAKIDTLLREFDLLESAK